MSSSPDAHDGKEPKKRGTKKRKKKGSSEPQRPVSAYALFFRDTQAAIKAENSSATFGEISKIVASMWDSLSEENKQVYKQKTENAKRDYLKHLAAFRANMISKGNSLDAEEEDSQPLSVLREKMVEQQRATTSSPLQQQANTGPIIDLTGGNESLPPPPKLHLAPGVQHIQQESAQTITNVTPVQHPSRPISPGAMLTKIIVPGQNGAQSTIHLINTVPNSEGTTVTTPPTPQTIQLRNIITQQNRSPITILPRQPGQIIKLVPSQEGGVTLASVNAESVKGRILKIDDIVRPLQTTSPGMSQASSSSSSLPPHQTLTTQEQTPILQLLAQESTVSIQRMDFTNTETPQTERSNLDGNELMQIPQQNLLPSGDLTSVKDTSPRASENQTIDAPRQCIRDGCTNIAVSNPYWDNEYCSNECVYSHCRDVFDAWVSTRQVTSSAV